MTPSEAGSFHSELKLREVEDLQFFRGVPYPARIRFRQLILTGPPGSGKSTLIRAIGGWPEEGFLDLSEPGWWRSRALAFRPREVHLGFPFHGRREGLALFEEEWVRAPKLPVFEIERIQLPPEEGKLSPWKWRAKYAFEFWLPPAERVFAARQKRSQRLTHPIDAELSLQQIEEQLRIYSTVARLFHRSGMIVFIRDDFHASPKLIDEETLEGSSPWDRPRPQSWIARLETVWEGLTGVRDAPLVELTEPLQLSGSRIRVRYESLPVALSLGRQELQVHPEPCLTPSGMHPSGNVLVFDPNEYASRISGFVRLEPGSRTRIGKGREDRFITPHLPKDVPSQLEIATDGKVVTLTDLHSSTGTTLARLSRPEDSERLARDRRARLARIRDAFGGPLHLLDSDQALACLNEVVEQIERDRWRPRDDRNLPGGLVELPLDLVPVIIGDLHARLDNLLKILSENRFLDDLESGRACVILLGDAVHEDEQQHLADMDNSLLMTDLILKLMLAFPGRFIYLRGTHESFSHEVSKGGVPQGQLWMEAVKQRRGEKYFDQLARFYDALPYVVSSEDFVACHAGPPLEAVSKQSIIDIRRHPRLMYQLTWNRLRSPGNPAGYTKRDVNAFKKVIGVKQSGAFIVSHNPPADDGTVWLDFGGIRGHHLVFSGEKDELAVLTRVGGELTTFVYRGERTLEIANAGAASAPS